ncbi:MAG TPA: hypothetical protein VGO96_20770 [Pyrinomonadaceae bacterium]|nr:hypothetical protein [Pyrinomonadaceae bacterium]
MIDPIAIVRVLLAYNLLVGLLLVVASEKLGVMTASIVRVQRQRVARLTYVSYATVGACLVALSLTILTLMILKP